MMDASTQAFVDAMSKVGLSPTVESGLVICRIMSVGGTLAGCVVDVGVALSALGGWPMTPPHWIHLPGDVTFANTNSKPSSKPGWLQHSRTLAGWGDAPPEVCWAAHLRFVLSEAV